MDTEALKKERGIRLNAARRRKNLSAEELVNKIAVRGQITITKSAIYAWEKGRNLLRQKVAIELAKVLDCSLRDLLGSPEPTGFESVVTDVLETIPLGGIVAQPVDEVILPTPPGSRTLLLELVVRNGDDARPLRQRTWQLTYDQIKKRIIIHARPGTSPLGLVLSMSRSDGSFDLPCVQDPADYNSARIGCDLQQTYDQADDEPVLFWRTNPEALLGHEIKQWIADPKPDDGDLGQQARQVPHRFPKDIETELEDFLDHKTAVRLCSLWEEGSGYLERYRSEILPKELDPYRQRLIHALILTTLQKNHELARTILDDLLDLTAQNLQRVADAAYLSGRNWWYLKQDKQGKSLLPRAIKDLVISYQRAQQTGNTLRVAQCLIYLSRIAVDFPAFEPDIVGKTQRDVEQMWRTARDTGRNANRADVEFLAERIRLILLHNQKQFVDEIEVARELLAKLKQESEKPSGFDLRNIEDAVRLQLGIALRRIKTESAFVEAEQVYQQGIDRQREDSHAGICEYLIGDLYADRAEIAAHQALESPPRTTGELANIDTPPLPTALFQGEALKRYENAVKLLRGTGDRLALQKANYRSLWIRQKELPTPSTAQLVVDSHVPRTHELTRQLIGQSYAKRTETISKTLLEEIIGVRNLSPSHGDDNRLIDAANYVDNESLVVLPWVNGDVLAIQLFAESDQHPDQLGLHGWIYLREYFSRVRPLLTHLKTISQAGEWSDDSWAEYCRVLDDVWGALQTSVEVIVPSRIPATKKKRIVVVAPDDPLDALIPFESLVRIDDDAVSLLDAADGSVLYAGKWGSPTISSDFRVQNDAIAVFSSHGPLAASSATRVSDQLQIPLDKLLATRTPFSIRRLPLSNAVINEQAVAIVAHDDQRGDLRKRIRSWTFKGTKIVLLMFCGSGSYELVRGPFTDGVAYTIRERLGPAGLVLANRLPVPVAEVVRILKFIHSRPTQAAEPFAKSVTDYLKSEAARGRNPLSVPWILL